MFGLLWKLYVARRALWQTVSVGYVGTTKLETVFSWYTEIKGVVSVIMYFLCTPIFIKF